MTVTLSREKHTVTNARRPVRQERSAARHQPMPVVAVTGAASGIGPAVTARLAASRHVKKVIAIDSQRGDIGGVTWRVADVRDPALAGRLNGVDVVVHADFDLTPDSDARTRRAFNVRGAQTVLTAAGIPVESLYVPTLGHGIDDSGIAMGAAALRRAFA